MMYEGQQGMYCHLNHRLILNIMATPWKHEITAPQAAELTLLVAGLAQ
jgi:hypothetical protein